MKLRMRKFRPWLLAWTAGLTLFAAFYYGFGAGACVALATISVEL